MANTQRNDQGGGHPPSRHVGILNSPGLIRKGGLAPLNVQNAPTSPGQIRRAKQSALKVTETTQAKTKAGWEGRFTPAQCPVHSADLDLERG